MKKIIFLVMASMSLISCSGMDRAACFQEVAAKYHNVIMIDDWKYTAIDDNNDIHYIETMSSAESKITKDIILYRGKCK